MHMGPVGTRDRPSDNIRDVDFITFKLESAHSEVTASVSGCWRLRAAGQLQPWTLSRESSNNKSVNSDLPALHNLPAFRPREMVA